MDSEIKTPHQLNPAVPEALSNLVMECVKSSPAKRPEMSDCIRRLQIVEHIIQRQALVAADPLGKLSCLSAR